MEVEGMALPSLAVTLDGRGAVGFIPWPLYSYRKNPRYPLDMGLGDTRLGLHALE
jgi:hypothetical protein